MQYFGKCPQIQSVYLPAAPVPEPGFRAAATPTCLTPVWQRVGPYVTPFLDAWSLVSKFQSNFEKRLVERLHSKKYLVAKIGASVQPRTSIVEFARSPCITPLRIVLQM